MTAVWLVLGIAVTAAVVAWINALAASRRVRRLTGTYPPPCDDPACCGRDDVVPGSGVKLEPWPRESPGHVDSDVKVLSSRPCAVCGESVPVGFIHYCRSGPDYRPQRTDAA